MFVMQLVQGYLFPRATEGQETCLTCRGSISHSLCDFPESSLCDFPESSLDSAGKGINIHPCRVKRGLHFVQK